MVWMLLIAEKGGYKVHSLHDTRAQAEVWQKCKEHDGDDTAIAHVPLSMVEEYVEQTAKG